MAVDIDLNLVLLILSAITNVLVIIAAIIFMVNVQSFQFIIIEIYVVILAAALLASDFYKPVACGEFFGFVKFYWGRFLVYLLLGALVFLDTFNVSFNKFAGGWTWAVAGLFGILALISVADRNNSLPKTIEPFKHAPKMGGADNTSAMSSAA